MPKNFIFLPGKGTTPSVYGHDPKKVEKHCSRPVVPNWDAAVHKGAAGSC